MTVNVIIFFITLTPQIWTPKIHTHHMLSFLPLHFMEKFNQTHIL